MDRNFAVIATWNGEDYVAACLQSLLRSDVPVQVIVVDNASGDRTTEIVRQVCPKATCFRLSHNLGFGRANNIGMKHAYDQRAEHVLLINQDARVEPDVVGGLIDLQRSNPEFGILSPLHLDGSGTGLDQLFCDHLSRASSLGRLLGDALLNRGPEDIYQAEFINAAVWMLSRECIDRVGLFNPAFKHYGEDREYADRVCFQGMRIGLVPSLRAFHHRAQDRLRKRMTLDRFLIDEEAIIRYRLSRKVRSTAFNLLSALSRVLFATYPGAGRGFRAMNVKVRLGFSLLASTVGVLRRRESAYGGGHCFFSDAEADRSRYSC